MITVGKPVRKPLCIDRCICSRVTFDHLKGVADEVGADSIEALQGAVEFGINCRLCHPYVRRMLRDGTTEFHNIIREDGPDPE